MWHVTAEEDMYCTECRHEIPSGTECLSQMPVDMPENFRRRKYENFCVDCADCAAKMGECRQRSRSCYVRRLDHWYTHTEKTPEPVDCGYCGETIPRGTREVAQKLYAWPESEVDSESKSSPAHDGGAAAGVAAGTAVRPSAAGWHNLSRATQRRFQTGGLGRDLGARSPAMAQRLYEKEVPKAIRNMGEDAVRDFLKGKHFSHVRSVANVPGRARAPSNIVLEDAGKNLARGSRNMTSAGRAAAKSAGRASAIKTGAKAAVKGGVKAGIIAAAAEAVVSAPENILHWKRGRKSGEQAAKDTAKSTATAAGVGVATAAGAKAAAAVGIGVSLGSFGAHARRRRCGIIRWHCGLQDCQGRRARSAACRVPRLLLQGRALQDQVCAEGNRCRPRCGRLGRSDICPPRRPSRSMAFRVWVLLSQQVACHRSSDQQRRP